MFRHLAATSTLLLFVAVEAQQVGTLQPEVHPVLPIQKCTGSGSDAKCTSINTMVVLDSESRFLHSTDGDTPCQNDKDKSWDPTLCPDGKTCAVNCALEGVDYADTYGITTTDNALTLRLVTGSNVGSRSYLLADDDKYYMFKLKNQELTFDVNLSTFGCGLNAALYLVQMDEDGGMYKYPGNKAGAAYGTGYCDAQCPSGVRFINGEANIASGSTGKYGSCCPEVDILEANSAANAYTLHPCSISGQYRCSGTECGSATCDMGGCGFNPFQVGNQAFYGPGKTIDTTKNITVVTQFITSNNQTDGDLTEVRRLWVQDGVVHENPKSSLTYLSGNSLTDGFCAAESTLFAVNNTFKSHSGMSGIDSAIDDGMVLAFSIWIDNTAQMLWLDGDFPPGADSTIPGVSRGPCAPDSGKQEEILRDQPYATATFFNIKIGDIGSTFSG